MWWQSTSRVGHANLNLSVIGYVVPCLTNCRHGSSTKVFRFLLQCDAPAFMNLNKNEDLSLAAGKTFGISSIFIDLFSNMAISFTKCTQKVSFLNLVWGCKPQSATEKGLGLSVCYLMSNKPIFYMHVFVYFHGWCTVLMKSLSQLWMVVHPPPENSMFPFFYTLQFSESTPLVYCLFFIW